MTVSLQLQAEIRRLFFAEHWKQGTIANQLGVHADVVRRVIGPTGHVAKSQSIGNRAVDPFLPFILETLETYPRLRTTRLFDMVHDRGYLGSVRTLRRCVADVRPYPKSEVFLRTEPLIAEQAQVDWAHTGYLPFPGGRRALWVFVMVLSYSRAMWAEFVFDLSVHSLRRSLIRAAAFFGGSPRQWLFDNPKTVVLERHGDAVRFHPALLEIAGAMLVQPRLCAVRKPQQKGRVERAIRYLRDRFLAARTIHSVEQGNQQLLDFFEQTAMVRPHPRWPQRSVAEVFAEEQPKLLALPSPLPTAEQLLPSPIDKCAFARFDTNAYSVPPKHARSTLTLVAGEAELRWLDDNNLCVATHPRSWGRHQRLELQEHREEIIAQKRAAGDLKGRDRLHAELPNIDTLFERWVKAGRNIGSMTAKMISLLDLYGKELLAGAIAEVVSRGSHDPGAVAITCEQRRRAQNRPVSLPVVFGNHVQDRDVIPHALEGYDV